jgi:ABC-2 type transport system ATP-binding protein
MAEMIRASGLVKRYGQVTALDGFDLVVAEGTVVGLLGPNGAGKTTAVRVFTTLLDPDSGDAEVAGVDVRTDPAGVRERIGLSGQYAAVDEYLTGFENLDMVGRLYRLGRRRSRERARELLERFTLSDAGDRPVKTYSGGMRRRLDLAAALVAQPSVLFLDEPTTGLDPRSRTDMWEVIRELVRGGTTLLLTTQYLEEADRLADDIVVIDRGRVIAQGTGDQLKAQVGGERVELVVEKPSDVALARPVLAELAVGEVLVEEHNRRLTAPVSGGAGALMAALRRLDAEGVTVLDVGLRRPTLDDVFLTLTGRAAEPEAADGPDGPHGPGTAGTTDVTDAADAAGATADRDRPVAARTAGASRHPAGASQHEEPT